MVETLDVQDVLVVRRRLAAVNPGVDFGATEPLRPDGLESAVSRQNVGWGDSKKYTTPYEIAATLFYGLALNHPFENGNKRTALVSMLVVLDKNKILLTDATEDGLYEMSTAVAAHSMQLGKGRERNADSETDAVANWLKVRGRSRKMGDRVMNSKDLKSLLLEMGCVFDQPKNNYVKIRRIGADGAHSIKIGWPRASFDMPISEVKRIRARLGFGERSGVDSGAFYGDLESVADEFINRHRQLLDRLALT